MKIAIITLWGDYNYGNRLQNYALQRVLEKKRISVETLVIDKKRKGRLNKIRRKYFTSDGKTIKFVSRIERKQKKAFERFNTKWICSRIERFSHNIVPITMNEEYDGFCVGSDQVWNPNFWGKEDQGLYLLSFAEEYKKFSYAASFGVDKLSQQYELIFSKELNRFSSISVREQSGLELVKKISRHMPQVVLDPTMLLDVGEWRRIEKQYKEGIKDKYVISLFLGKINPEDSKYIKKFASERKFKIIELQKKECKKYFSCGPDEFIYLIEHAEAVFTDSFHTVVFSILFHIPFVVFERVCDANNNMMSRLYTLLSMFHFENRIGQIDYSEILKCNFNGVDEIIENERKKSMEYLDDALEKIARHNQ